MSILEFHGCSLQNNGFNNATGLRIDNTGNRNITNTDNAGKNRLPHIFRQEHQEQFLIPPKKMVQLENDVSFFHQTFNGLGTVCR